MDSSVSSSSVISTGKNYSFNSNFTKSSSSLFSSGLNKGNKTNPSVTSATLSSRTRKSVIISLTEGRGSAKGEIGFAAMDSIGSTIYLSQFSDGCNYSRLFTKLEIFDPKEIILPSSLPNAANKNLFNLIIQYNPNMIITKIERKYFNDAIGWKFACSLCHNNYQSKIDVEAKDKYYCLAALAALIKYIEYALNVNLTANSLRMIYTGSEKTMSIDPLTARMLELIVNQQTLKTDNTLLTFLDHTKTKVGYRLLRATIREPPCDLKTIEPRFDLINEIILNDQLNLGFSEILSKFIDIENLISSLILEPRGKELTIVERRIDTTIYLKHVLLLVEPLKKILRKAKHSVFLHYSLLLDDAGFSFMLKKINKILMPNCRIVQGSVNIKNQKCFAIKSDTNGFLEKKRTAYNNFINDINEMANMLSEKYSLPIKVNYNATRGYHFKINMQEKKMSIRSLPIEFIRVSLKGKVISFSTIPLLRKNGHILLALEDILHESQQILSDLFIELRKQIGCLHKLNEMIGFIDLILSFATVSEKFNMVRPEFGDVIAIKSGCHPFLLNSRYELVANDAYLSEYNNIWIITGPNMSGKSTYLKQLCLLQIMAQCGCFVPAEKATFRLTDHIFTRLGSDDEIETNSSTFQREMKETKYIQDNFNNKSLIIFDELGKGTSFSDGFSICWAILETFLDSKAFVLLATHFLILTQLEALYCNVTNHHFQIERYSEATYHYIRCLYSLIDGANEESGYGIEFAEMMGIPIKCIDMAKEYANLQNDVLISKQEFQEMKKLYRKYRLARHLITLASKRSIKKERLAKYLCDLKTMYNEESN